MLYVPCARLLYVQCLIYGHVTWAQHSPAFTDRKWGGAMLSDRLQGPLARYLI